MILKFKKNELKEITFQLVICFLNPPLLWSCLATKISIKIILIKDSSIMYNFN